MPALPITSLYAGLSGLVLLWLSLRVVRGRVAHEVSLGDGGNSELLVATRAHANFSEYAPLTLLLIGLAEANGSVSPALLHALGGLFVASRIVHPLGLADAFEMRPARFLSMVATWGVILVASARAIMAFIGTF